MQGYIEDLRHHHSYAPPGGLSRFEAVSWVDIDGRNWRSVKDEQGAIFVVKHDEGRGTSHVEVLGECVDLPDYQRETVLWRFEQRQNATGAAIR